MKCSAIILAGGNSKRFKQSKGLVPFLGKPIIQHVVEKVSVISDEVLVVLRDWTQRRAYDAVLSSPAMVVFDELEPQSPLVGAYTGFHHASREYALLTACDTPLISTNVVSYLLDHVSEYDAVIARWPNGFIEPLQAIYHTEAAAQSSMLSLHIGQLRMSDMIRRLPRPRYISTVVLRDLDPRLDTYHNVNTPDDLRALEARSTTHRPRGTPARHPL